jgi:sporulation protein YlmC with PRC-barrel domain
MRRKTRISPRSSLLMTEKEMFEVVKYFKSIYTTINNKTEKLLFAGSTFYYEGNSHFLMFGRLKDQENNDFIKWSKDKNFEIKFSDVDSLRNCLKKNVVDLNFDTDFLFKYKDKEDNDREFLCSDVFLSEQNKNLVNKINTIESLLTHSTSLKYDDFVNKEIIELYLNENGTVSEERSSDKIVEIPFKRVQSITKDSDIIVKFSDKDEEGKRYVEFSSSNELLELSQIFATI